MKKHDEPFIPEQVDQQIERFSRSSIDGQDPSTTHEANARLLLDLQRAYQQHAIANQNALERVLDRLLQHEAQSTTLALSSTAQERQLHMERSISDSRQRHLPGWLAAAALLILLVGSMAVIFNLAHQQKANTAKQATTKATAITRTTATQSNLYITLVNAVEKLDSQSGKVLWTFTTPMYLYAPVTVANGVVYVVPQDNAIFALNAINGKLLWQTQYKHFSGSVVVAQNIVYARNSENDYLYALNAANGRILWQRHLGIPVVVLLVNDGRIYVTATIESPPAPTYSVLYALKASDGTELWHTTFSNQSLVNTSQIVDGMLYTSTTVDNKGATPPDRHSFVYAFDAKTGVMRWRSIEIKAYVGNAPVVANDMVYVGSNALGTDGPSVYAFRASDGSLAWQKPVSYSADSCVLADNGAVYVAEGTLSSNAETPLLALDASNGSVRWSHSLTYYYEFENHTCAINTGLIYIITLNGPIYVLRATDGTQVHSFSAGISHFSMRAPALVMAP